MYYSFECDYAEGACKEILEALVKTNEEQTGRYGYDRFTLSAIEKIKKACECKEAEVYLLSGGTQTNQIVIDTMLKPYEGVVSAISGHIECHEAGAVEYTGRKVLTIPQYEGKIKSSDLEDLLERFWADENRSHMVYPGMVYISHPTEYGTIYSKEELAEISSVCGKYKIPLFVDGARLAYGLMSKKSDLTLPDIAKFADVFYIGGTKVGALIGEAVVFTKGNMPKYFETLVKQHGAMLAKSRLVGIQFDTLFTDGLYMKLGMHAIEKAERLKKILKTKGFPFFIDSPTNQLFVILENNYMKELKEKVGFSFWEKYDANHTVVRFATSFKTPDHALDYLESVL